MNYKFTIYQRWFLYKAKEILITQLVKTQNINHHVVNYHVENVTHCFQLLRCKYLCILNHCELITRAKPINGLIDNENNHLQTKSEEKGFMGKVAFTAPRSLISQQ